MTLLSAAWLSRMDGRRNRRSGGTSSGPEGMGIPFLQHLTKRVRPWTSVYSWVCASAWYIGVSLSFLDSLATLPHSTHLPILLGILQNNPSLTDTVLTRLPQPDLEQCLAELERCADRTKRSAGQTISNLHASKPSGKTEKDVDEFCKTVSSVRFL